MISKENFLNFLKQKVQVQLSAIQEELASIDLEIANETKSSAGDKFETSREMMSQSRERLSKGLAQIKSQLWQIEQFQKRGISACVEAGSLVATQDSVYFFGMALGNVEIDGQIVKALSLQSPFGAAFSGKKVDDQVIFREQEHKIIYCQ